MPKIKANNTISNFAKKNNNNMGVSNRNSAGNNFTQENGGEQTDENVGIDEEDEKPKITKIVRVNKD